ncbi:hypothetical protein EA658_13875 [Pseudoxanthomonas winnipegensis]|uniref:Uncharacterized protein n=1 Tax=Pseudoxanthomonas winnipegensis TaxID=2480810 RepID=A0ABY1WB69_9GAMM|nr:hypothetical protein [Pseudoxanthomonas winnipegensis]TAA18230.1 hypothetical protein EA658_13875 [Pseudoxanthomonas winnipegensis]
MSEITVNVAERVWIDTEIEVDVDTIINGASESDIKLLVAAAGKKGLLAVPVALGDGDDSRQRHILDQAERALRTMATKPRELLDLMYYVHGRAIA